MPPETNIIPTTYVEAKITKRNEEYIMITKKELEMADNATTAIDMIYEWLLLISGSLLGYIISTNPSFTRSYISVIIFLFISCAFTIILRCKRKTTIEKILKIYEK